VPARPADERPRPDRRILWTAVVIAVVLGLAAGFGGGMLGARTLGTGGGAASRTPAASSGVGACDAKRVADDVLPAIVTIQLEAGGVGSGEIITKSGYIVTNNHVISPAADGHGIHVLFSSGEHVQATLVGRDPKSDLAVLKVSSDKPLPTVDFGDSETVAVGQPVVALGAPLGLSSTVTAGIVSALGRNVPVPSDGDETTILAGAIQTDAAINPGNSGGALVDCAGDLIGVNTAIATVPNSAGQAGGGSVGIGFAVPSRLVKQITDQLIKTGEVSYPFFGVQVTPIPHAVAERFGITDGLYIESVDAGGPADEAGLKPGDIVTTIDGQSATNSDVLILVTRTKQPGDTISVGYVRAGAKRSTTVTLGAQPSTQQ